LGYVTFNRRDHIGCKCRQQWFVALRPWAIIGAQAAEQALRIAITLGENEEKNQLGNYQNQHKRQRNRGKNDADEHSSSTRLG
jgi:hypothetical protein